jgi:hypothetical protein
VVYKSTSDPDVLFSHLDIPDEETLVFTFIVLPFNA